MSSDGKMSADDQQFLDFISSIPNSVRQYTVDVDYAGAISRGMDECSDKLRDTLHSTPWIPDSLRPSPPKRPTSRFAGRTAGIPSRGYFAALRHWMWRNQALTAAIIAFFGSGGLMLYYQHRAYRSKRRAKRGRDGSRTEVVVVAGAANSPIPRSVILDLERRGFIVYVVASSGAEEQMIKKEAKAEVLALHLDVTNPLDVQNTLNHFRSMFSSPGRTSSTGLPHTLSFAGFVVVPDVTYPSGPIEMVGPDLWSDALSAKVLGTVATVQALMPAIREFRPRIVMLTPTIISSLRPPFHGVESTVVGALEGFGASLQNELSSLGIILHQIRLGTFDCSGMSPQKDLQRDLGANILSWPSFTRAVYARNYAAQANEHDGPTILSALRQRRKGTPLRELNNAVFDAIVGRNSWSLQRIGQGANLYPVVGSLAPARLISWMMGVRQVGIERSQTLELTDSAYWEKVEGSGSH